MHYVLSGDKLVDVEVIVEGSPGGDDVNVTRLSFAPERKEDTACVVLLAVAAAKTIRIFEIKV